jgi:hypothetical protein
MMSDEILFLRPVVPKLNYWTLGAVVWLANWF